MIAPPVLLVKSISIHVLRVEDDTKTTAATEHVIISIHVLRVEDDQVGAFHRGHCASISIHVLRVEDDNGGRTEFPRHP